MCSVACYNISDLFGKIRTRYWRFGLVPVMDPIHRRFEDRSMRWSIDQYRFMQWRPDDDSFPISRHFMWVFILVYFFIYCCRYAFTCYSYHFMWLCVIFTSLVTCITSWDISYCSPYLFSCYELVSISFHVLVVCRCWLRPSVERP